MARLRGNNGSGGWVWLLLVIVVVLVVLGVLDYTDIWNLGII